MRQIALILIDYLKCQVFRHTLIFWASKVASAFLDIRGICFEEQKKFGLGVKSVSCSAWKSFASQENMHWYNFESFSSGENQF